MGTEIIQFVIRAFVDGHFPNYLNESLITLIPKQEVSETMAQFRPIALSNMVIKIITKRVANGLKLLMKNLVVETQCSFILGRQGIDNVVVVQEVIHSMQKKIGKRDGWRLS